MNTYEQSQLVLWDSYCDKKMECELLREKLEETLSMLEYSHTTNEVYYDHKKVSEFIGEMYTFMKESSVGQEEINQ